MCVEIAKAMMVERISDRLCTDLFGTREGATNGTRMVRNRWHLNSCMFDHRDTYVIVLVRGDRFTISMPKDELRWIPDVCKSQYNVQAIVPRHHGDCSTRHQSNEDIEPHCGAGNECT